MWRTCNNVWINSHPVTVDFDGAQKTLIASTFTKWRLNIVCHPYIPCGGVWSLHRTTPQDICGWHAAVCRRHLVNVDEMRVFCAPSKSLWTIPKRSLSRQVSSHTFPVCTVITQSAFSHSFPALPSSVTSLPTSFSFKSTLKSPIFLTSLWCLMLCLSTSESDYSEICIFTDWCDIVFRICFFSMWRWQALSSRRNHSTLWNLVRSWRVLTSRQIRTLVSTRQIQVQHVQHRVQHVHMYSIVLSTYHVSSDELFVILIQFLDLKIPVPFVFLRKDFFHSSIATAYATQKNSRIKARILF